jgi:hypothetical protein
MDTGPHRALRQQAPEPRLRVVPADNGTVERHQVLGGLINEYRLVA